MKMNKKDFSAGNPYSCWLREEMSWEVACHLNGKKDGRGLIKKHHAYVDNDTENFIMNRVKKLDDYPDDLRKVAVDIIRVELDPTFEK